MRYHRHHKYPKRYFRRNKFQQFPNKSRGRSINFYQMRRFVIRHPVFSAVFSIILSIFFIRISFLDVLFGNNISEFRLWFILGAIVLGIIGIISLKVWYKNNVSNFNVQANLNWKRR